MTVRHDGPARAGSIPGGNLLPKRARILGDMQAGFTQRVESRPRRSAAFSPLQLTMVRSNPQPGEP